MGNGGGERRGSDRGTNVGGYFNAHGGAARGVGGNDGGGGLRGSSGGGRARRRRVGGRRALGIGEGGGDSGQEGSGDG